jgi:SAM-dependent methyltransferase
MSTELLPDQPPSVLVAPSVGAETGPICKWIYETIQSFVKGELLELGSRSGNITDYFVRGKFQLRISDPERQYCHLLKQKYINTPGIISLHRVDPENGSFERTYSGYLAKFDTVIILNRVKSVPANPTALPNIKKLLRKEGHLIMFLPAYAALYEESDQGIEDWRRANRRYIQSLLGSSIKHLKTQFFRIIESGSAPKRDTMSLYREQVPFFSAQDDAAYPETGLFMIAIIKKI